MNHRRSAIFGGAVALSSFFALGAGAAAGAATPHASGSTAHLASATQATVHTATTQVGAMTETILVNAKGLPLYYYQADKATKSQVSGALAQLWPAVVSAKPTASGVKGKVASLEASRWSPGDLQRSLPLHLRRRHPGTRHGTRGQRLLRGYPEHSRPSGAQRQSRLLPHRLLRQADMATDHVDVSPSDRRSPIRERQSTVRGDAAAVPASERVVKADVTSRLKRARVLRVGVSVATVAAFVVLVLGRRTALTKSLGRIGHPQWPWIALGILLEASSMATFAIMQRRLLRVGGRRVGTRPMMATTFAANALSVSVPVAGPELGAAFTFRRFKNQGADPSLAGWTLLAGGLASWFGAIVVLAAGGVLSGNVVVTDVTILAALLAVSVGLAIWVGVRRTRLRLVVALSAAWVIRCVSGFLSRPVEDPAATVNGWIEGLGSLRPSKAEWGKVGGLGLANWLTDVGVLAVSILALGGTVPWRSLLLIYGLATLIGSLGITPGGLGLVEGTLCLGLVGTGLPAAVALAAVLLYRLVSFWLVMATGWLVLLWLRLERLPHVVSISGSVVQ